MIICSFEKYCGHCEDIEPRADILYEFNRPETIIIKCEHEEKCRRIYERIKEEQNDSV